MSIFQHYQSRYDQAQEERFSIQEFLTFADKIKGLCQCFRASFNGNWRAGDDRYSKRSTLKPHIF